MGDLPTFSSQDTTVKMKPLDPDSLVYQAQVAKACGLALDKRILAFNAEPPVSEKILDAPGMADDYYLNLLDWSNQNVLAIG